MKKVFPMFLAAALGLSLLGGCSSSGSGTTDAETSAVTEAETASVSETAQKPKPSRKHRLRPRQKPTLPKPKAQSAWAA